MAEGQFSPLKSKVHLYYKNGSLMPCEEDAFHEFKGHRDISVEDLPPWTQERTSNTDKASRRAVSRALNAYLNTGLGGTCYLGVTDKGVVHGLKLTGYMKDHVVGSLDDLMARYNPPVKQHRYKVRFVPVVDKDATEAEIIQHTLANSDLSILEERRRPHQFRSYRYCWCDNDVRAQYNSGVIAGDYVIEISIKPWDPSDPRNHDDGCGSLVHLHPYHEDEEGNLYFRRQASLVKYTMTEMAMLTKQEAREKCEDTIKRLREEILHFKLAKQTSDTG
ncbi:uncharacterized protein LOC132560884 [Ylistrum balloti]|uniref:uncharacterized protein LOC132560884 n=1 Tax=Ylistrum balloti TaxID=509963 RepID=UPI002905C122|nr:uncharacterized protein LOC132560884 [Ylistrum balloti]